HHVESVTPSPAVENIILRNVGVEEMRERREEIAGREIDVRDGRSVSVLQFEETSERERDAREVRRGDVIGRPTESSRDEIDLRKMEMMNGAYSERRGSSEREQRRSRGSVGPLEWSESGMMIGEGRVIRGGLLKSEIGRIWRGRRICEWNRGMSVSRSRRVLFEDYSVDGRRRDGP
ncbi:hypothetical protein Tco_0559079, partial [Tanacetum coccineum]